MTYTPSPEFEAIIKRAAAHFKELDNGGYSMALVIFERLEVKGSELISENLSVIGTGSGQENDMMVVQAARIIIAQEADLTMNTFEVN